MLLRPLAARDERVVQHVKVGQNRNKLLGERRCERTQQIDFSTDRFIYCCCCCRPSYRQQEQEQVVIKYGRRERMYIHMLQREEEGRMIGHNSLTDNNKQIQTLSDRLVHLSL